MKKWEKDGMTFVGIWRVMLHESWESYDSQDLYCEVDLGKGEYLGCQNE